MKKLVFLTACVGVLGLVMPDSVWAGCNGPVTISFEGNQDPDDNEFLYTSMAQFNLAKAGYKNSGNKNSGDGRAYECDWANSGGCTNGNVVTMNAGHVFKGKVVNRKAKYKCIDGVDDYWKEVDDGLFCDTKGFGKIEVGKRVTRTLTRTDCSGYSMTDSNAIEFEGICRAGPTFVCKATKCPNGMVVNEHSKCVAKNNPGNTGKKSCDGKPHKTREDISCSLSSVLKNKPNIDKATHCQKLCNDGVWEHSVLDCKSGWNPNKTSGATDCVKSGTSKKSCDGKPHKTREDISCSLSSVLKNKPNIDKATHCQKLCNDGVWEHSVLDCKSGWNPNKTSGATDCVKSGSGGGNGGGGNGGGGNGGGGNGGGGNGGGGNRGGGNGGGGSSAVTVVSGPDPVRGYCSSTTWKQRTTENGKRCCDLPKEDGLYDSKTDTCNCTDTTKEFKIQDGKGICVVKETNAEKIACEKAVATGAVWNGTACTCTNPALPVWNKVSCVQSEGQTKCSKVAGAKWANNQCVCDGKNMIPDYTLNKCVVDQNAVAAEEAAARAESRVKIIAAGKVLNSISEQFETSVWKNKDGGFNTARLASDSIAGVVLGTAGGLITSNVIKKNQIKGGFEDIKCTISGQTVADWGDDFQVGIGFGGNY